MDPTLTLLDSSLLPALEKPTSLGLPSYLQFVTMFQGGAGAFRPFTEGQGAPLLNSGPGHFTRFSARFFTGIGAPLAPCSQHRAHQPAGRDPALANQPVHAMSNGRRTSRLGVRAIPFGRTTIVVQALAALAFVVYLFASDNVSAPLIHQSYVLKASFDDAGGLDGGRDVTIAGVRVGKVTGVRYTGGRAVADLELDDDAEGRVHRDARVAIVPRSALQDQTVEITPGSRGGVLEDGDHITASATATPVQLDSVLETLDADSRAQLQILLRQLRTGLRGSGDAATRGARPPGRRRELQLAGRRRARRPPQAARRSRHRARHRVHDARRA